MQPSSSLAVQRRLCDSSGVLWAWEERRAGGGKEMKGVCGGSPWKPPAPEHLSDKHTHPLRKSSRCEGAGGNSRRSALTAAGCFPWKKRSPATPAGVKFHRSLTCNDITKHSAHLPLRPATYPQPAGSSRARVRKAPEPAAPGERPRPPGQRPQALASHATLLVSPKLVGD